MSHSVLNMNRDMVYASSSNMKCLECGDVGHKRIACPHTHEDDSGEGDSGRCPRMTQNIFLMWINLFSQSPHCRELLGSIYWRARNVIV